MVRVHRLIAPAMAVALLIPIGSGRAGAPVPKAKPQPAAEAVALPSADHEVNNPQVLSTKDARLLKQAFNAIRKRNWRQARRLASHASDPLVADIIDWRWLRRTGNKARFANYSDFLHRHGDWPDMRRLLRHAEEVMFDSIPDAEILAWFATRTPTTGAGWVRLAEAELRAGHREIAMAHLREGWINGNFPRRREADTYRRHRKRLTRADHVARLDRLLWQGKRRAAHRMLKRVGGDYRKLAEARLRLRMRIGGVDKAIMAVPDALTNDPGLLYERIRWRGRKGKHKGAQELLLLAPDHLPHADLWWEEQQIQARKALAAGDSNLAYRLASHHRVSASTHPTEFAEAEWFAGWLALRFEKDTDEASARFERLFENVQFPVSRARAAYWAGRAAEAAGREGEAETWYVRAAPLVTTFYGQLSAIKLDLHFANLLPAPPVPTDEERRTFEEWDLVRAIRMLVEVEEPRDLRNFFLAVTAKAPTKGYHILVTELARDLGYPELGVVSTKVSLRDGVLLLPQGYPLHDAITKELSVEPALLHAVVRQESEFRAHAVSRRGARGLMQLMPRTARQTARRHNIRYHKGRLDSDPAYNARLGSHYLAHLLRKYQGSYSLALAAYNAGETRVGKWLRVSGDPRNSSVDAIDWIEQIPYSETRNYVQRVMEGLQVYRFRLGDRGDGFRLVSDLDGKRRVVSETGKQCPC